jgi:hypothetical protein
LAESLGTAFLLATVVGSGVMAAKLAGGNIALALLGNTLPTGAILVVLILIFGPISGAHLNPAPRLLAAKVAAVARFRGLRRRAARRGVARRLGGASDVRVARLAIRDDRADGFRAMVRRSRRNLRSAPYDLRLRGARPSS